MSFVTNQYRGRLADLDGQTLTVALMDPGYIGGPDDTDLSTVSGELSGGGYSRQTVTADWDPTDGILTWDADPTFDVDTDDEFQTVLVADPQGDIVAGLTYDTPVGGAQSIVIEAAHIAAVADETGVLALIAALTARVAALENP